MIILKKLRWSNIFSYGENNEIDLSSNRLTQLSGKNGNGKSSIALILEEVLYNKNSKSIKKSNLINRNTENSKYKISLEFSKDSDEYFIEVTRGSTQKVKLEKNGEDISSHTATNTFKEIENILGIDHKTFAQIVYQSNSASLNFLSSPDSARKKFLIELLNLTKYTELGAHFKQLSASLDNKISEVNGHISSNQTFINKHKDADLNIYELEEVPFIDDKDLKTLKDIEFDLKNIASENKKIRTNNTYKKALESIDLDFSVEHTKKSSVKNIENKARLEAKIAQDEKSLNKFRELGSVCPTCEQNIDSTTLEEMKEKLYRDIESNRKSVAAEEAEISRVLKDNRKAEEAAKKHEEWEKYHSLIDTSLREELLDKNELLERKQELEDRIEQVRNKIQEAEAHNRVLEEHNSKAKTINDMIESAYSTLETYKKKLGTLNDEASILKTLTKTFGNNGLVAYKIENLIKELQDISNGYLTELSGGRFQVLFELTGSEKLNATVVDEGKHVDITDPSTGELARINIAVLLAIRKIMQSLSDTEINLLFLDETMSTLDIDGKEKLIELLLEEKDLNTVVVSHEYTHPLIHKIYVDKVKGISKLT